MDFPRIGDRIGASDLSVGRRSSPDWMEAA
jgi:hypothetical protein